MWTTPACWASCHIRCDLPPPRARAASRTGRACRSAPPRCRARRGSSSASRSKSCTRSSATCSRQSVTASPTPLSTAVFSTASFVRPEIETSPGARARRDAERLQRARVRLAHEGVAEHGDADRLAHADDRDSDASARGAPTLSHERVDEDGAEQHEARDDELRCPGRAPECPSRSGSMRSRVPRAAPRSLAPLPSKRLVPPITAAAITSRRRLPPPVFVATDRRRDASMISGLIATAKLLIMKTAIRTRSTSSAAAPPRHFRRDGRRACRTGVRLAMNDQEEEEDPEDHDHLGDAAVLVCVPDGGERDDRKAQGLEDDQHRRLPREPARPAGDRHPQLDRGVRDDDDDRDDPAPELAEEVVCDSDDPVVLNADRPAVEYCVVRIRTTPTDQQTGEGNHERRHTGFVITALARARSWWSRAERHRPPPTRPAGIVGSEEQRHHDCSHGADEGDREVDLPDQQHETTSIAIVATAAICRRRFVKLRSVRNLSSRIEKGENDQDETEMIGSVPSSPALTPCHHRRT